MTGPTLLPRPTGAAARVVRSVLVGVVVAACGVAAHTLGGGRVAAEHALLVAAAAALVTAGLAGRRLTTGQLLGLLVLGQVGTHLVAGADHGGAGMLPAHVVATVLSLLLVRQGENAWWRLADAALARLTPPVAVVVRRTRTVAAAVVEAPHARVAVLSVGGRAPPVGR